MSDNRIENPWKSGYGRPALFAIFIFILMALCYGGLVSISIVVPLTNTQEDNLALGSCILIPALMVVAVLIWGAYGNKRRFSSLDVAFARLGLTGRSYLLEGRQYHGIMSGRPVDVYFYRGPKLDIYIFAHFNTRLGIGLRGRYTHLQSGVVNRPLMVINDPEMAHLGVYPQDAQWSRALVENPAAKGSILTLTTVESKSEYRNLQFQPEALFVQLHRFKFNHLTTEKLRFWISESITLSETVESLPSPTVTAAPLDVERWSRSDRSGYTVLLGLITIGIIAFFTLIIIIFMIILNLISLGR
jgi:hypothetical protein